MFIRTVLTEGITCDMLYEPFSKEYRTSGFVLGKTGSDGLKCDLHDIHRFDVQTGFLRARVEVDLAERT